MDIDEDSEIIKNIRLNPIEKYRRSGKFPFKLIIHLLLVFFTTAQVISTNRGMSAFSRSQEMLFYSIFFNSNDQTSNSFRRFMYFLDLNTLSGFVNNSIQNYFNLNKLLVYKTVLSNNSDPYVSMIVNYNSYEKLGENITDDISFKLDYSITKKNLSPFSLNNTNLRVFLSEVSTFQLIYSFNTYVPIESETLECYSWVIYQNFDYKNRAHLQLSLEFEKKNCQNHSNSQFISRYYWMNFIVIFLSSFALVLVTKSVVTKNILFEKTNKNDKRIPVKKSSSITQLRKREFKENSDKKNLINSFKKWNLIFIVGHIIQIFGCLISVFNTFDFGWISLLIGLGCLFSYINLIKYIGYNQSYSTIYSSINNSFPYIMKFIIGLFIIIMIFLTVSFIFFSKSGRFSGVENSLILLFCVANGDGVYDTFKSLLLLYPFWGIVYLTVFLIAFTTIGINIIVAILEESYIEYKTKRHHWIQKYLELNKTQTGSTNQDEALNFIKEFSEKLKGLNENLKNMFEVSVEVSNVDNEEVSFYFKKYFSKKVKFIESLIEILKESFTYKEKRK